MVSVNALAGASTPASASAASVALTTPSMQLFVAFDYGEKRCGMASGNRLTASASPLPTVAAVGQARWDIIAARIKEWAPHALVVGVPYHPDGAPHDNTRAAKKFARQLHGRFNLPVFEVDERYSTTEAHSLGARDADAASACIILEQFLAGLHARPSMC
jgi:putative holliday junction resolvase